MLQNLGKQICIWQISENQYSKHITLTNLIKALQFWYWCWHACLVFKRKLSDLYSCDGDIFSIKSTRNKETRKIFPHQAKPYLKLPSGPRLISFWVREPGLSHYKNYGKPKILTWVSWARSSDKWCLWSTIETN